MSVGNRVFLKRKMPDLELVEKFRHIPTANIGDCMNRVYGINAEIKLMSSPRNKITTGVALTVKTRPGDNLMIHKAINISEEGDVIIVSNEGERNRSLVGEVIVCFAHYAKNIRGMIFDGPIRDIDEISVMDFPVYATGTTAAGPYKEGPGEVNVPICIGGVTIKPGDIVVMDSDGIVIVPISDAQEIYDASVILSKNDIKKVEAAKNKTSDRSWVDKKMVEKNCDIIDDFWE